MLAAATFAILVAACGETSNTPVGVPRVPTVPPNFGVSDEANGPGACMGDDAFAFGGTSGMGSATDVNCTAEDIEIATAVVSAYSFTGTPGSFTPLLPGQRIQCDPATQPLVFIETSATLQNNAQSRYDIGVWIEADPNNPVVEFTQGSSTAVTGSCTHYNLVVGGTGVSNLDTDACGDMAQGSGLATIDLDVLTVPCQDDDGDGVVEIGACIGWQNVINGPSRVCQADDAAQDFRNRTTPNNKAKCNCDPMVLPIDIAASLDIEKQSIGGTGEFDYTVSGSGLSPFTRNTATQGNPTATNPVVIGAADFGDKYVTETAEPGFTLTNISCTANGAVITIGTGQGGAFDQGATAGFDAGDNTVRVTVGTGDSPTCTFVNTATASLDIEKQSVGGTETFDFTASGSGLPPGFTRNTGTANPTANAPFNFSGVQLGDDKYVTEGAETGFTLTNITCTANGAVIAIGTGQGGAFAQGATAGFDPGDNTVKVTLTAGDSPTCLFENTLGASIDIEKQSIGGTAEFDYTVLGAPLVAFTRNTATQGNPTATAAVSISPADFGDKYVTEGVETGFTLTNITCTANGAVIAIGTGQGGAFNQGATAGFDVGDNTVKITVGAGDTPTCTFVNTKDASIDVEKLSVGGTETFDYMVSGAPLVAFTRNTAVLNPTANAPVVVTAANFGDKYVTESAETGFTLTNISCTANGAVIVIGTGQGGAFNQNATAGFDPGDNTVKITVDAGDTPTCTFENTLGASIDIEKQSIGGTAEFDYTVLGAPLVAFTRNTATQGNPTATAPVAITAPNFGDKYVTETAEAGYTLTSINCTANGAVIVIGTGQGGAFNQGATAGFDVGDNTVKVTIDAGDNPTCTFVNTKDASLDIEKQSIGGTAEFDYTVLGAPLVAFTRNTATQGNPTATAPVAITAPNFGDKYVTETAEAGYTLTSINCTANGAVITIGTGQGAGFSQGATAGFDPGDNTVKAAVDAGDTPSCTFVNTKLASLTLRKIIINDNGGTAGVNAFGITTNAGTLIWTCVPSGSTTTCTSDALPVTPGTYNFSETPIDGYTEGNWSCSPVAANPGATTSGTVTLGAGQSTTCEITNNDDQPAGATLLIIDEDGIDNGLHFNENGGPIIPDGPQFFSDLGVNDDKPSHTQRDVLRYFAQNIGQTITVRTGQTGDEGWFAPNCIPQKWISGGSNTCLTGAARNTAISNYFGLNGAGGIPAQDRLDKIPAVMPLRALGLNSLVGKDVCAVVYDSDISINYNSSRFPFTDGNLQGETRGIVAFHVNETRTLNGFSSSTLPEVQITILNTNVCGSFQLFNAPVPTSSSVPNDRVAPGSPVGYRALLTHTGQPLFY